VQNFVNRIFSLKAKSALEAAGITHVVSVLRMRLDRKMFETDRQEGGGEGLLKRLMIEANDVEEENLIQHFAGANEFIVDAHANGGAVLIHWFVFLFPILFWRIKLICVFIFSAMGKSRSATVLAAYLMWSQKLDRDSALALIRKYRPYAEPNPGFMEQLDVYYRIGYTQSPDDHPIYQRWLYKMELQSSRAGGRAPERVHFRDVERKVAGIIEAGEGDMTKDSETTVELRCRRCRCVFFLRCVNLVAPYLVKSSLETEGGPGTDTRWEIRIFLLATCQRQRWTGSFLILTLLLPYVPTILSNP
jgi:protein-tyrosine phosphatase